MKHSKMRVLIRNFDIGAFVFLGDMAFVGPAGAADAEAVKPAWQAVLEGVPAVGWLLLAFFAIAILGTDLLRTVRALLKRIEGGAAVELGGVKIGANTPSVPDQDVVKAALKDHQQEISDNLHIQSADEQIMRTWDMFSWQARGVMLVHSYYPSNVPKQIYDVELYLVERETRALRKVHRVEYYFGPRWEGVFVVDGSHDNLDFRVRISAYDRFVCAARIHFVGGSQPAVICRYVDFEFGRLPTRLTAPSRPIYPETRAMLAV